MKKFSVGWGYQQLRFDPHQSYNLSKKEVFDWCEEENRSSFIDGNEYFDSLEEAEKYFMSQADDINIVMGQSDFWFINVYYAILEEISYDEDGEPEYKMLKFLCSDFIWEAKK